MDGMGMALLVFSVVLCWMPPTNPQNSFFGPPGFIRCVSDSDSLR